MIYLRLKIAVLLYVVFSCGVIIAETNALSESVVIVRGTLSASGDAERTVCSNTADRISSWLAELSVGHTELSDEDVVEGALSNGCSLAIFPFNPYLPDEEIAAMESFVRGGGKLLLFYASSPKLATLMGMRVGGFTQDPTRTLYHVIRPAVEAPANWPERVGQHTPHIIPVYSVKGKSMVSAYWEDAHGGGTEVPAWVHSDKGAWMSYILMAGDDLAKKRILLAWITHFLPDSEQRPSDLFYNEIEELFGLVDQAVQQHFSSEKESANVHSQGLTMIEREKKISLQWKKALKEKKRIEKSIKKGETHEALVRIAAAKKLLFSIYGMLLLPVADEFRGVWDHTGLGLYPGDWDRTCKLLHDKGFTAVFPNMLSSGYAHYSSRLLPESEAAKNHGDQIVAVLKAARKHGLEVHVWKVCWQLTGASEELIEEMRSHNRLQVNLSGESLSWLCPSDPANVDREIFTVMEIVLKYEIDGIHLDYIRYPGSQSCYCSGCRKRFEKFANIEIENWPEDVTTGEIVEEYKEWRAGLISGFVERLHKLLSGLRDPTELSAAVFGHFETAYQDVGQDWRAWVKNGWLDFICPMNYTDDLEFFTRLADDQLPYIQSAVRFYPGIGITCNPLLNPIQTIDQINILRDRNVSGFVLFDLKPYLAKDILPFLRFGTASGVPEHGTRIDAD